MPPPNPPAEVTSHGPPADELPPTLKAWETASPPGQIEKGFTRVRILYATDRQRAGDTPDDCYGSERGTGTTLTPFECGQCDVSVPYKHDPGEIERPAIWKLEFTQNPARHVTLLAVRPLAGRAFVNLLREDIRQSATQSAFLFVHGFNVEFAEAARRTAQMKYDLGFDGAAVMYTWPAPKNYVECEGNAVWTRPHLVEFLTQYLQETGAQRVHLIAHSMGTRVLSDALSELGQTRSGKSPRYNQIILAAPDIDAAIFRQQIAPRIVNAAERISIYASSEDVALLASKKAHHYVRLGEGGKNLSVFPEHPKIEVLDASGVDRSLLGHSYYGDSPTILRDLRMVLSGVAADRRGVVARNSYFLFFQK
ncbi:MAG: alpha/beta hydrolase [Planctomycetota bacterium]|nr:alpha/beta hydrolase [Planctomycetota bacterium]